MEGVEFGLDGINQPIAPHIQGNRSAPDKVLLTFFQNNSLNDLYRKVRGVKTKGHPAPNATVVEGIRHRVAEAVIGQERVVAIAAGARPPLGLNDDLSTGEEIAEVGEPAPQEDEFENAELNGKSMNEQMDLLFIRAGLEVKSKAPRPRGGKSYYNEGRVSDQMALEAESHEYWMAPQMAILQNWRNAVWHDPPTDERWETQFNLMFPTSGEKPSPTAQGWSTLSYRRDWTKLVSRYPPEVVATMRKTMLAKFQQYSVMPWSDAGRLWHTRGATERGVKRHGEGKVRFVLNPQHRPATDTIPLEHRARSPSGTQSPPPPFRGCTWDSRDWSCAYDAVFASLCAAYTQGSPAWRASFDTQSPLSSAWYEEVSRVIEMRPAASSRDYDDARDRLRGLLAAHDEAQFPRRGTEGARVDDIFKTFCRENSPTQVETVFQCSSCLQTAVAESYLSTHISDFLWDERSPRMPEYNPNTTSASVATWLPLVMAEPPLDRCHCNNPEASWQLWGQASLGAHQAPPILAFDCAPFFRKASPLPSRHIHLPSSQEPSLLSYSLRSVIYFGGFHFSSRLFLGDGTVWTYDGREAGGIPVFEVLIPPDAEFPEQHFGVLKGRQPVLFLYARDSWYAATSFLIRGPFSTYIFRLGADPTKVLKPTQLGSDPPFLATSTS